MNKIYFIILYYNQLLVWTIMWIISFLVQCESIYSALRVGVLWRACAFAYEAKIVQLC